MGHLKLVVSTVTGAIVVVSSPAASDPEAEARRLAREGVWSRQTRTFYPGQSILSIHVTDSHEWVPDAPEPRSPARIAGLDVAVPSA